MINKLIEVQFGKPCAEFWAKYPENSPLNHKDIFRWKSAFKKHGKFNTWGGKNGPKPGAESRPRWKTGSSSNRNLLDCYLRGIPINRLKCVMCSVIPLKSRNFDNFAPDGSNPNLKKDRGATFLLQS